MTQHTKDKLADALRAIPGVSDEMIRHAAEGYYHDYLSSLPLPEFQLVNDLRELANLPATPHASRQLLREMMQRVIDGDFDASVEEGDEWAASPDGQEAMRKLLRPPQLRSESGHQAQ